MKSLVAYQVLLFNVPEPEIAATFFRSYLSVQSRELTHGTLKKYVHMDAIDLQEQECYEMTFYTDSVYVPRYRLIGLLGRLRSDYPRIIYHITQGV